mmetsp:Transcript_153/g.397  ORF Transcript_153/g.397 Transcript_153/m.397 type:complete len:254 (+) Transcript_153:342-1103(+)
MLQMVHDCVSSCQVASPLVLLNDWQATLDAPLAFDARLLLELGRLEFSEAPPAGEVGPSDTGELVRLLDRSPAASGGVACRLSAFMSSGGTPALAGGSPELEDADGRSGVASGGHGARGGGVDTQSAASSQDPELRLGDDSSITVLSSAAMVGCSSRLMVLGVAQTAAVAAADRAARASWSCAASRSRSRKCFREVEMASSRSLRSSRSSVAIRSSSLNMPGDGAASSMATEVEASSALREQRRGDGGGAAMA